MENPKQKFRQSSIVFEKSDILSANFDKLQLPDSSIFLADSTHTFRTYQCLQKGVWDFFCLDFELLAKIKKGLVSTHSLFIFLLITQNLNKIKKISNTLF